MLRFGLFASALCAGLVVSACSQSETVPCGDSGVICPAGWVCIADLSACIDPNLTTCGDGVQDEGEACDDGNLLNHDTCNYDCTVPRCGDGFIDTIGGVLEVCDDGDLDDGDGCSSQCDSTEFCGDGVTNDYEHDGPDGRLPAEQCDAGVNGVPTASATCDDDCTFAACGDGKVNALNNGEQCDGGDPLVSPPVAVNTATCTITCKESRCGDEFPNPAANEQCDLGSFCEDGTTECASAATCSGIGGGTCGPRDFGCCTGSCTNPLCGDGITQTDCNGTPLELCDNGKRCADAPGIPGASCTLDAQCAGNPTADKTCAPRDGDGCSAECDSLEVCGDGFTNTAVGEVCDDGKDCADGTTACTEDADCATQAGADKTCAPRNGGTCNFDCKSTGACGDKILNNYEPYNEVCDDGRQCDNGDPCIDASDCAGGTCDVRPNDGCSIDCKSTEQCGNGQIDGIEECDYGPLNGTSEIPEDAELQLRCSLQCRYNQCGNMRFDPGETCDNGTHCSDGTACVVDETTPTPCAGIGDELCQARNGDGCSAECVQELGWDCPTPSELGNPEDPCVAVCGDFLVRGSETCDDNNVVPADGCGATCVREEGWSCPVIAGFGGPCGPVCGDGVKSGDEQCDDDDTDNGDGCSSNCDVEVGWSCPGDGNLCFGVCGDALRRGTETCDDDDTDPLDGCSATCQVETGWTCSGATPGPGGPCAAICGDGIELGDEDCDDDDLDAGDGCSANCDIEVGWDCPDGQPCRGICGDALRRGAETCDDDNADDGDGCSSTCQVEDGWACGGSTPGPGGPCDGVCGNGRRDGSEACDDGDLDSGNGCSSTCLVEAGWDCGSDGLLCTGICGDGLYKDLDNEECDDSNTDDGDGCSATCQVETGWSCLVNENAEVGGPCDGICGDNVTFGSEICDDGDLTNGNGCNSSCNPEPGWSCPLDGGDCTPVCGDGIIRTGETCDDNNVLPNDGCSATCQTETGWACPNVESIGGPCNGICGDGFIRGQEQCDDNDTTAADGCSNTCIIEAGWSCPNVAGVGGDCTGVCGDGFVKGLETCDDSNTDPGDGCDASCAVETGWSCPDVNELGGLCSPICGDGAVLGDEQCDDSDTDADDGCSDACVIEIGWECPDEGEDCNAICGDFVIRDIEECDDGTQCADGTECQADEDCEGIGDDVCVVRADDGCDASCQKELGWECPAGFEVIGGQCLPTCGDGLVRGSEECDDNDALTGDGCDSSCQVEDGWACPFAGGTGGDCSAVCGDGLLRGGETCDDDQSTPTNNDGCSTTCQLEVGWTCPVTLLPGGPAQVGVCSAICGDGLVRTGETCDDSNTGSGDGCSNVCLAEGGYACPTAGGNGGACTTNCGDGLIRGAETCDEGAVAPSGGCVSCQRQAGFSCPNVAGAGGLCTTVCNDFLIRGAETCDDGNTNPSDGCGATCLRETGWDCPNVSGAGGVCTPHCNDGLVVGTEQCDDSDLTAGDGCGPTCQREVGWTCPNAAGVGGNCSAICGDGLLRGGETCDDIEDPLANGDGCTTTCQRETGWQCPIVFEPAGPRQSGSCDEICGDGILRGDESCDEGAGIHTLGCIACVTQSAWTCTTPNTPCVLTPVVTDDALGIVKGAASFNFSKASLVANDLHVAEASLTIPAASAVTGCGASVAVSGANVVYTPLAVPTCGTPSADSFTYRVCSPSEATLCREATATIEINQAPVLADAFVCAPTVPTTANASINVATSFSDADSDALATGSIVAAPTAGGTATLVGTSVRWALTNTATATTYNVTVTACDSGNIAQGCDDATFAYRWNDPPVLTDLATTPFSLARGDSKAYDFSVGQGNATTGLVTGLPASDVTTNPIAIVRVSTTQNGVFGTSATTTRGECTVSGRTVTYTANNNATVGNDSCWIEVCEPCSATTACAKVEARFSVSTCFDTEGVGERDAGCPGVTPVCKTSPSPSTCVECSDAGDCGGGDPGWTCVLDECVAPPGVAAVDDLVGTKVGDASEDFAILDLLDNDANYDEETFELVGVAECGDVTIVAGDVHYVPPVDPSTCAVPFEDTFDYEVCNEFVALDCDTATVTIEINRAPTFDPGFVCVAPSTANATIDVAPLFDDADGDLLVDTTITPGTLAGGTGVRSGSSIVWTPTTPANAANYDLTFTASDDGIDPATGMGTLRFAYNDAPTIVDLETVPTRVVAGGLGEIELDLTPGEGIVTVGTVEGRAPGDSGNLLASIAVRELPAGIFSTTGFSNMAHYVTVNGNTLEIASAIDFDFSFEVRVCEVCGATPVCTNATVAIDVVACDDTDDGVVDPGCVGDPATPACNAAGTACVECTDDADCDTDFTCESNVCEPPLLVPNDDTIGYWIDDPEVGEYAFSVFLDNDDFDDGTIELVGSGPELIDSECGGIVSIDAPGVITYVGPDDPALDCTTPFLDSFQYSTCNQFDDLDCGSAMVFIELNETPVVAAAATCVAVGSADATLDVAPLFTDADNLDRIENIVATGIDGTATGAEVGTTIVVTPASFASPDYFSIAYEACDDGLASGCGVGAWELVYNDPPALFDLTQGSAVVGATEGGPAITVLQSAYFVDFGLTEETGASITSVTVSTDDTTYAASAPSVNGGTCAIDAGTGTLSYTPPTTGVGIDSCYIMVCESCSATPVCRSVPIEFDVAAP